MQYHLHIQGRKASPAQVMCGMIPLVFLFGWCMHGFGNIILLVFLTGRTPQSLWTNNFYFCPVAFQLLRKIGAVFFISIYETVFRSLFGSAYLYFIQEKKSFYEFGRSKKTTNSVERKVQGRFR